MRFAPFFFFFLNFGLNRPIRPIPADMADSNWFTPIQARIGPIPHESARFGASSVRVGFKKMKATWHHVAGRMGSSVPRVSPRSAASDAGAAPLVPRLCFTVDNQLLLLGTIFFTREHYLQFAVTYFRRTMFVGAWSENICLWVLIVFRHTKQFV